MISVDIPKDSLDRDAVSSALQQHFTDAEIESKGSNKLFIRQDKTAAIVKVKHKYVFIENRWPTWWGTLTWWIVLFLFGVILPLIVYAFTRGRKMRAFESEIAETIRGLV